MMISGDKDLNQLKTDIDKLKTNIEKWQNPDNKLGFLSKIVLQISTWWSMVKIKSDISKCEQKIQKKYENLSKSIQNINSKTSTATLYKLKNSLSEISNELQFLSKIQSPTTKDKNISNRVNQFNASINEISTERLRQQINTSSAKVKKELNQVFNQHGELSEHIHSAIILAEFGDSSAIEDLAKQTQMKSEKAISDAPSESDFDPIQAFGDLEIPTHEPIISSENKEIVSDKKPSFSTKIDAKSVDISKIDKEEIVHLKKTSNELKNQLTKLDPNDPVYTQVHGIIISIDLKLEYMKECISSFHEAKKDVEHQIKNNEQALTELNSPNNKIGKQDPKWGVKNCTLLPRETVAVFLPK